MKLITRSGIALGILAGAAFVAAGCGGDEGGASSAAQDAAALDLVPKDAVAYATFDTDFTGDGWEEFNHHATAFQADFKGVSEEIDEALEGEDGDYTYKDDIDPWLGESAGVAIISVDGGEPSEAAEGADGESGSTGNEPEVFAWVELEDRAKFESFLEDEKFTKDGSVGDFDTWKDEDDDSWMGVSDDYAILAETKEALEERAEYDGDSVTDADGLGDVIDEAGDDALATVVVNGEGVRTAVEDSPEFEDLGGVAQLDDFKGLAVTVGAEDDGLRVHGFASGMGEDAGENAGRDLFTNLPGNTVFAVGAHDFGGTLQRSLEAAGEDNAEVQQGVGAITSLIGVDLDEMASAFGGEFALALSASDEGLGAIAGGAMGAAMGGGLEGVDPAQLAQAGAVTLAFEETGEASETLNKIAGALGPLAGGAAAKEATAGDFTTQTLSVQGLPITTGASDEVAALSVGSDVFGAWGEDTLGENETFSSAWEAADAPDETAGTFWVDFPRVAELLQLEGGDAQAGGWVGWAETDGSDASFDVFMHVEGGDSGE